MRARLVIAAAVLALVVVPFTALASWSAPGSGYGYGKAHSMSAGNTPSASVSGRNVTVSWTATGGSVPVSGYVVKRYDTSGGLQTIGASCSGTVTSTSCTESAVPAGSWKYSVTPVRQNWQGAESAQSSTVTVNAASMTLTPTTLTSLPATQTGSIADFVSGQTVTFRLDNPNSGTVLSGSINPTPVQTNGTATVSVTIPSGTSNGSHTVYAVGSSGDIASQAITVNATPSLVYGGAGSFVERTNSGTSTVPYPSGTAANDLLFLVEINGANQAITTPSGWTLIADQATSSPSQFRFTVWQKLAGAETSVSLRMNTNSSGASALVLRYNRPGGYPPNPSSAMVSAGQGVAGATTTMTPTPDVTTNGDNASVISIVAIRAANTLSLSQPQSFSLQLASTGTNVGLGVSDLLAPTSGTTPASPTWSQSGTAAQWAFATVAYK